MKELLSLQITIMFIYVILPCNIIKAFMSGTLQGMASLLFGNFPDVLNAQVARGQRMYIDEAAADILIEKCQMESVMNGAK